jgi:hypothetical protein
MFVCCGCCLLSGKGICDELITRPEESCRLWCVTVWCRNLVNDEDLALLGLSTPKPNKLHSHDECRLFSHTTLNIRSFPRTPATFSLQQKWVFKWNSNKLHF